MTIAERKEKADQLVKELQKQLNAKETENPKPPADCSDLKVVDDTLMSMSTTSDKFTLDEINIPPNLERTAETGDDACVMNESFKQQLNIESLTSDMIQSKSDILNANSELKTNRDRVLGSTLSLNKKPDSMNNVLDNLVEMDNRCLTKLQINTLINESVTKKVEIITDAEILEIEQVRFKNFESFQCI